MGQGIIYGDNAIFATKHFKSKGCSNHTRKLIYQCNFVLRFDRKSNLEIYILCVQMPRILSYLQKLKIRLKAHLCDISELKCGFTVVMRSSATFTNWKYTRRNFMEQILTIIARDLGDIQFEHLKNVCNITWNLGI